MNFLSELVHHLTGGYSAAFKVAALLLILFGALINILYDVQTRNVSSIETPMTWDWKYFWKENRLRFGLNLLIAMAVVRFFTDLTGRPLIMEYCFLTGIAFDAMFVVYRKLRKRVGGLIDKYLGTD